MSLLQDRVALVTGGSRGIGKAIARALAEQGAKVAICARDAQAVRQAADEISPGGGRVLALRADVAEKSEAQALVRAIVARWGQIHILVNNAGINDRIPIDSGEDARWLEVLRVNVVGTYYVTREVLRHMPNHDGGRIINISSVLGRFGVPGYTAYCTAKHGIIGFTRALALEVVRRGITVNAICPGWVETDLAALGMRQTAEALGVSPEEFRRQALGMVPIQRILQPKEIADLAVYLASDASAGMTGQTINICGGQVMS